MSAASSASLLAALADLNLVTSVISAMRTADITAARDTREPGPVDTFHPSSNPTPVYTPRQVLHPTPLIEPRAILHPTPRVEPLEVKPPIPLPTLAHPKQTEPVFQPPWKVLPWPTHVTPAHHFKPHAAQPDMQVTGLLIDIFV